MASSSTLAAFVFLGVAAITFFLGYRIRVAGDVHLIAGYDADKTRDPRGLARWVGGWAMALGVTTLAGGIVLFMRPAAVPMVARGLSVCVAITVAATVVGSRRFLK